MEKEPLFRKQGDELICIKASSKEDVVVISPRPRRSRSFGIALAVAAFLYLCWSISGQFNFDAGTWHWDQTPPAWDPPVEASKTLVPLEAHIMSKCPDAKVCLKELVLPTMQRVSDKVDFTLSYIGTPTANDGVECMHGAEECMGNIIELCAAYLYPEPRIYLGFVMCMTRDYQDIPQQSLVEDCTLEHGIDFEKLNDCSGSDDGFGISMLRKSVTRSKEAGVTASCTVRLNEEIYCIHDGDWKQCPSGPGVNDLVIAIEKLYNSS